MAEQPLDPGFLNQMEKYWGENPPEVPGQGIDPFDFPLQFPQTGPWTEDFSPTGQPTYMAPNEDMFWEPGSRYHQGGPMIGQDPGFGPTGPPGDWGGQQYPYNPVDYEAPWNVGPYPSWPGYTPAQPHTPEWDYMLMGPFAGGPGGGQMGGPQFAPPGGWDVPFEWENRSIEQQQFDEGNPFPQLDEWDQWNQQQLAPPPPPFNPLNAPPVFFPGLPNPNAPGMKPFQGPPPPGLFQQPQPLASLPNVPYAQQLQGLEGYL